MTDSLITSNTDRPCILIDDSNNKEMGTTSLIKCHTIPTQCHRAFSLFLFNTDNELLIQQRSKNKLLYPLHWSNTVCSHTITENPDDLLVRLNYETNLNLKIKLTKFSTIKYNSNYNGLYGENEIDELYFGICDIKKENLPLPNPNEVAEHKFVSFNNLQNLAETTDILVTPWFRAIIKHFKSLNVEFLSSPEQCLIENNINPNAVIDLGKVDKWTNNRYTSNIWTLFEPYAYINSLPSKGIRDLLIKAICKDFKVNEKNQKKIQYVISTIHNASLIIDDIEDGSEKRRGYLAAHKQYPLAFALNAGYLKIFELLNHVDVNIQPFLINRLYKLHIGQGADAYAIFKSEIPTKEEYVEMILHKTGALFDLILDCVIFYKENNEDQTLYRIFLHDFALYFQIRDDYLNATEYSIEKGFFEDLDEGKYSYLMIICLGQKRKGYEEVLKILKKDKKTIEDKQYVIKLMEENGTFTSVKHELSEKLYKLKEISPESCKLLFQK
jgi:isopentenyl-diphosphate delta-isomerase type 1